MSDLMPEEQSALSSNQNRASPASPDPLVTPLVSEVLPQKEPLDVLNLTPKVISEA